MAISYHEELVYHKKALTSRGYMWHNLGVEKPAKQGYLFNGGQMTKEKNDSVEFQHYEELILLVALLVVMAIGLIYTIDVAKNAHLENLPRVHQTQP